jgi:hypothetical protein
MDGEIGLVQRPPFTLRSLPVRYRWEATRRHPYYAMFWELAHAGYQNISFDAPDFDELRRVAVQGLYAIGVSGDPPDPALDFEALSGDQVNPAWLSGAVHPVSFQGLAGMLITYLEPAALNDLGALFLSIDPAKPDSRMQAIERLMSLPHETFNQGPPEPYVSVNPAASGREIGEAIDALLAQWKALHGLSEQRVRSDKFDDYFRVWDMREGWSQGTYDRSRDLRLGEIAKELKQSHSTIDNRYRKAFELIVGYAYHPRMYHELFDIIKFSELVEGGDQQQRPDIRTERPKQKKPVPESSLGDFASGRGPATSAASADDRATTDFWLDLSDLIDKGRSDAEIGEEMELPIEAVVALRSRLDDGLENFAEK